MYKRGDIVLIPFPFTDLTGAKIDRCRFVRNRQEVARGFRTIVIN